MNSKAAWVFQRPVSILFTNQYLVSSWITSHLKLYIWTQIEISVQEIMQKKMDNEWENKICKGVIFKCGGKRVQIRTPTILAKCCNP